jgi:hypothetical protein
MLTDGEILQLIADCENKLWRLEKEMAGFNARRNPIIEHHIQCAKQIASNCLGLLADSDWQMATLYIEIAILRTDFAAGAFEAERTETLLGESDYLELDVDWRRECTSAIAKMEEALTALQTANDRPLN